MLMLILGVGAAIAVVLAVLVCGGLLVGSLVRKARKGKASPAVTHVPAPAVVSPYAKAEAEFAEMMAIVSEDSHELFKESYKAEQRARFEALKAKAPVAK